MNSIGICKWSLATILEWSPGIKSLLWLSCKNYKNKTKQEFWKILQEQKKICKIWNFFAIWTGLQLFFFVFLGILLGSATKKIKIFLIFSAVLKKNKQTNLILIKNRILWVFSIFSVLKNFFLTSFYFIVLLLCKIWAFAAQLSLMYVKSRTIFKLIN